MLDIDKKNAVIDAKVKTYIEYEKKKSNEVVNAYVMFRSMEGKERAI